MANDKKNQFNQKSQTANSNSKDQWKAKDISRAPSTAQSGDMTDVDTQQDLDQDSDISSNRQTPRTTDR